MIYKKFPKKSKNRTLVIFDMCGTIYAGNSTLDYCFYLMGNWLKSFYRFFLNQKSIFLLSIFRKIFGIDFERMLILSYFKGLKDSVIGQYDNDFLEKYSSNMPLYDFFKSYLRPENDVIILSASIDPPIKLFATKEKVSYFSSTLEKKDGIFTGRFLNDLLGQKSQLFISKKIILRNYDKVIFVTDNQSDVDLIELLISQNKFLKLQIVLNNNREFWLTFFSRFSDKYSFSYDFI